MKKVTLKDIAKEVGVTVGTVSHVLNGVNDISEVTRKRVTEAAERLGYVGNQTASSLRTGKSGTVAVIVPDISNPHIAYQIKLIEDYMKRANYSVIILNTDEDEKRELDAVKLAYAKQVDGVLLCPSQRNTDSVDFLEKTALPYLLIGRYFKSLSSDYVSADDRKGGAMIAEYLIERGCKKPIYIGAYSYVEASKTRLDGMIDVFSSSGIEIPEDRIFELSPRADASPKIEEIFSSDIEYDSVIAFSDIIAFEVMAYFKKNGIKGIAVAGFDAINKRLSLPLRYASVGMTADGWAGEATEALLSKIEGNDTPCKKFIDVELSVFE